MTWRPPTRAGLRIQGWRQRYLSAWGYRVPLAVAPCLGFLVADYLTLYQLRVIGAV